MWNAAQHNLDHISNHGMNIKTRVIQSNSLSFDIKEIILRASQQTIMSFKISMLQNVIPTKSYSLVCSLFLTQGTPHAYPGVTQAVISYFQYSQTFSTLTQYMSVSHGYSIMGGIEYDDGDYVRKQKGESLTLARLINGLWRCPSIDVNTRSRHCHATDALEL